MKITVQHRNEIIKTHIINKERTVVGSANDCDLILNYPTVSKKHCEILFKNGEIQINDLKSRNGTSAFKNGKVKLASYELHFSKEIEDNQNKSFDLHSASKKYLGLLRKNKHNALEDLRTSVKNDEVIEKIFHEFHANGPVDLFLQNKNCKEILINRFDCIFTDIGSGLQKTDAKFISDESFQAWASRMANTVGRRLDLQNPICEATLKDGSRFHAVLPPISAAGLSVSIRRFGTAPITEEKALESKWMSVEALSLIKKIVSNKVNIVISGGTSTGKTSLLNFVCRYFDPTERIITIEDTIELKLEIENQIQLQARKPNADGIGEIPLRALVQSALRMRPDRIIVGECRGDEVIEMLQALNTGHPGSLTTVHANSCKDAIERLELLAMLGAPNLTADSIRRWIASSVECVIQVERAITGRRFIKEIALTQKGAEKIGVTNQIYEYEI